MRIAAAEGGTVQGVDEAAQDAAGQTEGGAQAARGMQLVDSHVGVGVVVGEVDLVPWARHVSKDSAPVYEPLTRVRKAARRKTRWVALGEDETRVALGDD